MKKGLLALSAFVTIALALSGCGSNGEQDYGTEVTSSSPKPESLESKIKRIEDNPNMPADAKQKAIAGLRAGGGGR